MAKRSLRIDGRLYYWSGGRSVTNIWTPDGKRYNFTSGDVNGMGADIFERGQYKRTSDGMVTPSDVKRYIQENRL